MLSDCSTIFKLGLKLDGAKRQGLFMRCDLKNEDFILTYEEAELDLKLTFGVLEGEIVTNLSWWRN